MYSLLSKDYLELLFKSTKSLHVKFTPYTYYTKLG